VLVKEMRSLGPQRRADLDEAAANELPPAEAAE
jgi:hypothetical protein